MLKQSLLLICISLSIISAFTSHKIGPENTVTDQCYFDIYKGENIYLGRLIIGLFGDDQPMTVKNFYHLCKGDKKNKWKRKMTYAGSPFHANYE